jgi:hypothetical protein
MGQGQLFVGETVIIVEAEEDNFELIRGYFTFAGSF